MPTNARALPLRPSRPATTVVEVLVDDLVGGVDAQRWAGLLERVLLAEGASAPVEVNLSFVDEAVMGQLHLEHLGLEGPTDVLSFPLEDDPKAAIAAGADGPPVLLGDAVVCVAVARRQAAEHGVVLDDELALLVTHAGLHLLGYDHEVEAEAEAMESREGELIRSLHDEAWERHR